MNIKIAHVQAGDKSGHVDDVARNAIAKLANIHFASCNDSTERLKSFDEKKEIMNWPISVSPYECAIIPLVNKNDNSNLEKALNIYKYLNEKKIDTIIDDTDENFSSKIKKFNLIGIPFQVMIGKKSEGDLFEFNEIGKEVKRLSIEDIAKIIINKKK